MRNMNYALNYMYSELVFQLDGNNINIDVTFIQCFAFGYHTNKISITNTTMGFCIINIKVSVYNYY